MNKEKVSFNLIFGGVALSSVVMFIPIYANVFKRGNFGTLKIFLLSLHNTIRLFIVDGEFTVIMDNIGMLSEEMADLYVMLAAVLFVIAPFLTFGVVLSFFKNISAYKAYFFSYFSDVYIFSELNEEALMLARSLKENDRKRKIIFTDVFEANEETVYESVVQAHELGSIMFKKDIAVINFKAHSKNHKIVFFIIQTDDDENVKQTLSLIKRYYDRENVALYVFTTSINSELVLNRAEKGKIKVRRLNEVQSLINRHLYDEGMKIFKSAVDDGEIEKTISAIVVGMGQRGTEMIKSLSWFCQMDGYRLELHAFDKDSMAASHFCYKCPELMDDKYNHDFATKGEAHYSINIHSGIDAESKEFLEELRKLKKVTYIFISLGDDERNIRVSVMLRSWLLKQGYFPVIDAVVRNPDKKKAMMGITNYSGQEYEIDFIGDIQSSYSEDAILESDIEHEALQRHLRWGKEEDFWKYEYNYRSSIASAIHKKMKLMCEIPGASKELEQRTEVEKRQLRELEHRRWNAYMRSEGFTYAEKRNDLAKTHCCLVPFDDLLKEEQEKDD